MATFATLQSAQNHLIAASLSTGKIDATTDQARDALIFTRRLLADAEVPVGTSKLGGAPDLPKGMDWPTRPAYANAARMLTQLAQVFGPSGHMPKPDLMALFEAQFSTPQPLAFLAQFDLTALSNTGSFEIGMPSTGRLWVFVDPIPYASGASPWDEGWIQIIHDTSNAPLHRTPPPEAIAQAQRALEAANIGFETGERFDPTECERLTPHAAITLPMPDTPQPCTLRDALNTAHMADFANLLGGDPDKETLFSDQLGGHPHPIQNNVERALFTAAESRLRAVTNAERAGTWDPIRWQHILSIGGESYMSSFPASWGDGDLFVSHRPDPAHPNNPGQVWAISQQT